MIVLTLVPAAALAAASYRVERAGDAKGTLSIEARDGGWIAYDEDRGATRLKGELRYDEAGAIVEARFSPLAGGDPLIATVAEGQVALRSGEASRSVDVPPTHRARLKPGRTFLILWKLNPAVLLGITPLAVAAPRGDTEATAVVVDPADGVDGKPTFAEIRLVRERRPRTVTLADGRQVDGVALDVAVDDVTIMTIVCGKDGTIYAYRIVARQSPRFGETGVSSLLP